MIIFGVGIVGFLGMVVSAMIYPAFVAFDKSISASISSIDSPVLDTVFKAFTRLGDLEIVLALTLGFFAFLWFSGRRPEGVLLIATVALGTALGSFFKDVFERARPDLEHVRIPIPDTYSFPSGHALASFLLFSTLAFIVVLEAKSLSTRVAVIAVGLFLGVGVAFSRVYLGVHYVGDVIASWMLGAAWMTVTTASYFWFTRQQSE